MKKIGILLGLGMLLTSCVVTPLRDCDLIETDVYVNGFFSHTEVEEICYY